MLHNLKVSIDHKNIQNKKPGWMLEPSETPPFHPS